MRNLCDEIDKESNETWPDYNNNTTICCEGAISRQGENGPELDETAPTTIECQQENAIFHDRLTESPVGSKQTTFEGRFTVHVFLAAVVTTNIGCGCEI